MSHEVEIGRGKRGRRAYTLDDIALVPARRTRDPEDVNVGWQIDAYHVDLPLMAAPMDSVMSPETAIAFGRLGGIGEYITHEIEKMTGVETRNTILGHIQRGGAPTGYDRVLATRLGMGAVDMVAQKQWGKMVSVQGTEIKYVPLEEALDALKTVPQERWEQAAVLFGR